MDYGGDTHLFFLHTVKKSVHLKLHVITITGRFGVDLVYFVLACKKSNLGEALAVNLPLLKHIVDKNRQSTILIAHNFINI